MKILNPDYEMAVRHVFEQAAFVQDMGIRLLGAGPGWCETELLLLPRHMQQSGTAHAGVPATIADHTAGGAATTVIAAGQYVLTAEFKLNLLRPARGEKLRCRAEVLKPGRTLAVVEADVFAIAGDHSSLVAKGIFTLAVVSGSF